MGKKSENNSNANVFRLDIVQYITLNSTEDNKEDRTELQL